MHYKGSQEALELYLIHSSPIRHDSSKLYSHSTFKYLDQPSPGETSSPSVRVRIFGLTTQSPITAWFISTLPSTGVHISVKFSSDTTVAAPRLKQNHIMWQPSPWTLLMFVYINMTWCVSQNNNSVYFMGPVGPLLAKSDKGLCWMFTECFESTVWALEWTGCSLPLNC